MHRWIQQTQEEPHEKIKWGYLPARVQLLLVEIKQAHNLP